MRSALVAVILVAVVLVAAEFAVIMEQSALDAELSMGAGNMEMLSGDISVPLKDNGRLDKEVAVDEAVGGEAVPAVPSRFTAGQVFDENGAPMISN